MRELKKPLSFKTQCMDKDLVVTVTGQTITFRQKRSKQTLAVFWYVNLIKKFYKL